MSFNNQLKESNSLPQTGRKGPHDRHVDIIDGGGINPLVLPPLRTCVRSYHQPAIDSATSGDNEASVFPEAPISSVIRQQSCVDSPSGNLLSGSNSDQVFTQPKLGQPITSRNTSSDEYSRNGEKPKGAGEKLNDNDVDTKRTMLSPVSIAMSYSGTDPLLFSHRRQQSQEVGLLSDDGLGDLHGSESDKHRSDRIKLIKRRNNIIIIMMVLFAVFLAACGGTGVGLVNSHFSRQTQKEFLREKNGIVLDSSASVLDNVHTNMRRMTKNVVGFFDSYDLSTIGNDAASARDHLRDVFLQMWSVWVSRSEDIDVLRVYIPFCDVSDANNANCSYMALGAGCCSNDMDKCFMTENTDNGTMRQMWPLERGSNGIFKVAPSSNATVFDPTPIYFLPDRTGSDKGYLQGFSEGYSCGVRQTFVTYREQVLIDDRYLIVDSMSYFNTWLSALNHSTPKAPESSTVLFSDDGVVLAYIFGDAPNDLSNPPCRYVPVSTSENHSLPEETGSGCGEGRAGVVDKIVSAFLEIEDDKCEAFNSTCGHHTCNNIGTTVGGQYVAYQNFFRFNHDSPTPHHSLIVAYASPMDTSIDRRGISQIIICVVIILVCVIVLGTVTILTVFQIQRILALISLLAVHVATYDTAGMEKVLQKTKDGGNCCSQTLFSWNLVNEDFSRILSNLKGYRSFLPQAVLTQRAGPEPPPAPPEALSEISSTVSQMGETDSGVVVCMDSPALSKQQLAKALALRQVKGTIMVVEFSTYSFGPESDFIALNDCIALVVTIARGHSAVVEVIESRRVVISFNCHFTVPRHQERACKCALDIDRALLRTPFSACIGIASSILMTCNLGTQDLKAKVLIGEAEFVARKLCRLSRFLSLPILATDHVVHNGAMPSVPVDVITLHWPTPNAEKSVSVSEVVRSRAGDLPLEFAIAKRVFRFMRSRQHAEALATLALYRHELNDQPFPWRVRRLELILQKQQTLVETGYRRREVWFEGLEGSEEILNQICVAAHHSPAFGNEDFSSVKVPIASTDILAEEISESNRAKHIIEDQMNSRSRRARNAAESVDSSEALFPVYVSANASVASDADISTAIVTGNTSSVAAHLRSDVRTEDPTVAGVPRRLESVTGQVFYRSDHVLGRGGFGVVFLGIAEIGSFVAIKVLPISDGDTQRLLKEVETLQRLQHGNIVAYDTCGVQGEHFFIIMEYIAAGNVRSLVSGLGSLPEPTVRRYCRGVLRGLQYLHTNGCLHCDIKPDNILLTEEGDAKLADFGTASLERSIAERPLGIQGTPKYMAPEAVLGRWSPQADVFSLGITVAYMLTGRHPWHERREPDHIFLAQYTCAVKEAQKTGMFSMQPCLPDTLGDRELQYLVSNCCAFDPNERPSVEELLDLLA